ncbi:MAG: DnaJ domain-containing protein [Marinobacterium sp.]
MHPLGLILFAAIALGSWYWWDKQPPDQRRSASWKLVLLFITIGLLLLAITGRLHWLGVMIALILPFLKKLLPMLLRFSPLIAHWWRSQQQKKQTDSSDGTSGRNHKRPNSGRMDRVEALDVLGLRPDANREDILAAHRRLIQKLHPDREGSAYLAAKINEARDVLLDR